MSIDVALRMVLGIPVMVCFVIFQITKNPDAFSALMFFAMIFVISFVSEGVENENDV